MTSMSGLDVGRDGEETESADGRGGGNEGEGIFWEGLKESMGEGGADVVEEGLELWDRWETLEFGEV